MDDEETELRNPFPSPPSHYTRYTNHNLKLLELQRAVSLLTRRRRRGIYIADFLDDRTTTFVAH